MRHTNGWRDYHNGRVKRRGDEFFCEGEHGCDDWHHISEKSTSNNSYCLKADGSRRQKTNPDRRTFTRRSTGEKWRGNPAGCPWPLDECHISRPWDITTSTVSHVLELPVLKYDYNPRPQPAPVEKEKAPPRMGRWEGYIFTRSDRPRRFKAGCALNHENRLEKARHSEFDPEPIPMESHGFVEYPGLMTQAEAEGNWESECHKALELAGFKRIIKQSTGRPTEWFECSNDSVEQLNFALAVLRSTVHRLSQAAA